MLRFELYEGGQAVTIAPLAVESVLETSRGGDPVAVIAVGANEFVVPDADRTVASAIAEAQRALLEG